MNPQFKYQTPIEAVMPDVAEAVIKKMEDTKIEVTIAQLFAICPDVCWAFKERLTTRRVQMDATNSVLEAAESFLLPHLEQEAVRVNLVEQAAMIVGQHILSLRVVEPLVEGKLRVECILDQGAQVIAMRKGVWERLGLPLRSDMMMTMESANQSKDQTLGLLQNLKFEFGPVELILHVQVVNKAPFDVLLGHPFFALLECSTKDYSDGDQHIMLTDPNSREIVTIPTRERTKGGKTEEEVVAAEQQGF